ncbi:NAD-dependent epimerase/dehydratase family protein [Pseudonocardia sp. MH-G8]|uniref:NAD-dependent epimerase/dehydratase family protein n=1 Tax=Pseudonocardia sp. MH-G8 TaxID=1854588 RepID=UPI000BA0833B|nr:hypothetical protein CFP66_28780 [Pseudonocardia sp. MH-G8]
MRCCPCACDKWLCWQTNVGGTLVLLHTMSETGTRRLVLASTCGVYGDQVTQPINESAAAAPTSPYGTSKLAPTT